jgi:hypothetical protein
LCGRSARDRYNKLKERAEREAEENCGEYPYWIENDLLALEVECDYESITALCKPENGRNKVEQLKEGKCRRGISGKS